MAENGRSVVLFSTPVRIKILLDIRYSFESRIHLPLARTARASLLPPSAPSRNRSVPPVTTARALLLCSLLYCAHSSCRNIRGLGARSHPPRGPTCRYFIQLSAPYKDFSSTFERRGGSRARARCSNARRERVKKLFRTETNGTSIIFAHREGRV